ncbi:putative membrane protein [Povalibacter uvarum]|uniref:Putative membrane protein n=1 Tax=Povalibacter uvarum TaxID=732238 RepID=A0A841HU69_9GAMM|nr:urate hydroxylase PuuD [Povalibacter uvarum]MBB6095528.1 putative membrane protein [Povalibacter uvarum]
MEAYLFDWLSLLGRWLHLIAGIAWIGASFYFVWLDNHLLAPERKEAQDAGVAGELWAVHGGGFYHSQKYRVAPEKLPGTLHWFYWEAYTTWLSGFFLLCLLYYGRAELYLIDPAVAQLSKPMAIALGLGFLAGTWVIYDLLCRSPLGRNDRALGAVLAVLLALEAWALCHIFSGRGAFIQFGAALGTVMVANVFFVIIPGQRELVKAKLGNRAPDPIHGLRGKQRSVHNTYFTLPVLFTMISHHYAMTYGATRNWLVLIGLSIAGAAIRAWFVARHKAHERGGRTSPIPALIGIATLAVVAVALAPAQGNSTGAAPGQMAQIEAIFRARCQPCHSATPTFPGFAVAPNGMLLDTREHILASLPQTRQQLATNIMPIGNVTGMTAEERATVISWIDHGAPQ